MQNNHTQKNLTAQNHWKDNRFVHQVIQFCIFVCLWSSKNNKRSKFCSHSFQQTKKPQKHVHNVQSALYCYQWNNYSYCYSMYSSMYRWFCYFIISSHFIDSIELTQNSYRVYQHHFCLHMWLRNVICLLICLLSMYAYTLYRTFLKYK